MDLSPTCPISILVVERTVRNLAIHFMKLETAPTFHARHEVLVVGIYLERQWEGEKGWSNCHKRFIRENKTKII